MKILIILAVALVIIIGSPSTQSSELIYEGKPESYWLRILTNFHSQEFRTNWRILGTNKLPILLKAIEQRDGKDATAIRTNAAILLSQTGDSKILIPIAKSHPDPQIRMWALYGLTADKEKSVTMIMVDSLKDKDPSVRRAAVAGLCLTEREKVPAELAALVQCFEDIDSDVRLTAARILCEYYPYPPGQEQDVVAETALPGIKKAASNPDHVIREAANKALKENNQQSVLEAFAHELALKQAELHGTEWKATVKVVDEVGQPVTGSDVTIGYYVPPPVGKTIEMRSTKGKTDINGLFLASGRTGSIELFFGVSRDGYYRSHFDHEFAKFREQDPNKWNPAVTLVLKKIGTPIPLYAKKEETKVQREKKPVGFDLMAGDWVAPYGKGKNADMFFTVHRKVVSLSEYDAELKLTFPNPGDGIVVTPPELDTGSELRTARLAAEGGYEPERVWHYSNSAGPESVFGYFFRVRTILAQDGTVKSALYGKIQGDFRFYVGTKAPRAGMGFTYYLNPTPNDRNLEFDPGKNLFESLKFDEQVKEP